MRAACGSLACRKNLSARAGSTTPYAGPWHHPQSGPSCGPPAAGTHPHAPALSAAAHGPVGAGSGKGTGGRVIRVPPTSVRVHSTRVRVHPTRVRVHSTRVRVTQPGSGYTQPAPMPLLPAPTCCPTLHRPQPPATPPACYSQPACPPPFPQPTCLPVATACLPVPPPTPLTPAPQPAPCHSHPACLTPPSPPPAPLLQPACLSVCPFTKPPASPLLQPACLPLPTPSPSHNPVLICLPVCPRTLLQPACSRTLLQPACHRTPPPAPTHQPELLEYPWLDERPSPHHHRMATLPSAAHGLIHGQHVTVADDGHTALGGQLGDEVPVSRLLVPSRGEGGRRGGGGCRERAGGRGGNAQCVGVWGWEGKSRRGRVHMLGLRQGRGGGVRGRVSAARS